MAAAPVIAETVVPVRPTEAFVGFTAQMGEWWDPLVTPDASTYSSIEIDPEGEVAMVHEGARHVWGRVTTWEPLGHYAQDFWLGHSEDQPTHLDVTFTEESSGTRVRLEHSGWQEGMDDADDVLARWENLLARYAAHVS